MKKHLFFPTIFIILLLGALPAAAREITVALLQDEGDRCAGEISALVQEELASLAADKQQLAFRVTVCPADGDHLDRRLRQALDDPRTDLVVCLGPLVSSRVAGLGESLSKPLISWPGLTPDAAAPAAPLVNAVRLSWSAERDLQAFRRLKPFQRLHIIGDDACLRNLPDLDVSVQSAAQALGAEPVILPADRDLAALLSALDRHKVEAVYLLQPLRLSPADQERLFAELAGRGLPTFSSMGITDVEQGALAGIMPDIRRRSARRIALNAWHILQGTPPSSLPATLEIDKRLVINTATARTIGLLPHFAQTLDAVLIGGEGDVNGRAITLGEAMRRAAANNISLSVTRAGTDIALQDKRLARSRLLPNLGAGVSYLQVDDDRADASWGSLPRNQTATSLTLSQSLFDDELISALRAAGLNHESTRLEEETRHLDLLREGAESYLDYLSTEALARMEESSLATAQENLDLARLRSRAGIAGPEEIYRLESEEARRKSSLLKARAARDAARTAFNQTLNVPLDTRWDLAEIDIRNPGNLTLLPRIRATLSDRRDLEALTAFLIARAQQNAPELQALDKGIKAQDILLGQKKRSFYLPKIQAQVEYDHEQDRESGDIPPIMFSLPPKSLPQPADDNNLTVGVQMTLPLCTGGARVHELAGVRARREQLVQTRARLAQRIEQQVRTTLSTLEHSDPDVVLTARAFDRATLNLQVVQDKYARGEASVIDLIDAQNEAVQAEQSSILAGYNLVGDCIAIQRAIGWFAVEQSPAQRDAWLNSCRDFQDHYPTNQRGAR